MNKTVLHREPEQFSMLDAVITDFQKHRVKLYLLSLLIIGTTLVVLLLLPNQYRATAKFMPDNSTPTDKLAAVASSIVPSELLSSTVMNKVQTESGNIQSLLTSNSVLDALLETEFDNLTYYNNGKLEDILQQNNRQYAREKLKEILTTTENVKSGIIKVNATTNDKQLSASLANKAIVELDRFKQELNRKQALENKEFYTQQLKIAEEKLALLNKRQSDFLSSNRNYMTSSDPVLKQQVARYQTDILFQTKIVIGFKQMLESTEMELNRNTPTIKVIEDAEVPLLKAGPPRTKYMIISILGSIIFGFGLLFLNNAIRYYFPNKTRENLTQSVNLVRTDLNFVVNRIKQREERKVTK